ncbi:MAG: SDR family NAD(P)-dependent oxidoreductase, partial [Hydrogenophilaceae bacterium]
MQLLVTGGAGYIGSHTCVELLKAGHEPVVVDNLCNSKVEAIRRVECIAGRPLSFHQADIRDRAAMRAIFARHRIEAVVHFAGL